MEQAAVAVVRRPDWTSGNRCSHVAVGDSVTNQPEALRANPLGGHSDGCIPGPILEISSGWGWPQSLATQRRIGLRAPALARLSGHGP